MATYWENSCSFGLRSVFVVWVPGCWFGVSHLGFWSGSLSLIAPFPDLCLLVPFDCVQLKDLIMFGGCYQLYIFSPSIIP